LENDLTLEAAVLSVFLEGCQRQKLRSFPGDIEKEIKVRPQQDVQNARERILAIAQEAGLSVEELLRPPPRIKRRRKAARRYRLSTKILVIPARLGQAGDVSRGGSRKD
jgi:hypothetical protein